jgi:hypothetical protein
MAIGTTETISNYAARSSAVRFYKLLLKGSDVQAAFIVCRNMLEAITAGEVSAELHSRADVKPATEIMNSRPVLVADFTQARARISNGVYWFQLGLLNCPPATTQIVFTTDDGSFVGSAVSLQDSQCLVVRPHPPAPKEVWSPHGGYWTADRDHRLFAVGIKIEGRPYTVTATLCEAVESWYRFRSPGEFPLNVSKVLESLREIHI